MRMRRILSVGVLLATVALAAPSARAAKHSVVRDDAPYVYVYPVDRPALDVAEYAQKSVTGASVGTGWRRINLGAEPVDVVEIRNLTVTQEPPAAIAAAPAELPERTPLDWGRDYGRLLILLAVPAAFLGLHLHLSRRAYIVPPSS